MADRLHDYWFDAEALRQETRPEVTVAFWKRRQDRGVALPDAELTIRNVVRVALHDTERVQFYDFNGWSWDEREHTLSFVTGIPIGVKIEVRSLNIDLRLRGKGSVI